MPEVKLRVKCFSVSAIKIENKVGLKDSPSRTPAAMSMPFDMPPLLVFILIIALKYSEIKICSSLELIYKF